MNGLEKQTIQIPLAAGLNQKADDRALSPPSLLICKDAQFDELGGIQTRKPYAAMSTTIFGGGTLTETRRIVENGAELLCFTKDALYSWSPPLSAWVRKGTHLAAKQAEVPVFVTTGDQITPDRAELNGTVCYTWADAAGAYLAATDASGAVLLAPTWFGAPTSRPRLVALDTKILLLFYDGINGLYCYGLDPANPGAALAGSSTTVTATNYGTYFDVVKLPGSDAAMFASRRIPTTSYTVGKITSALVVTTSVKARDCDGPIAVACEPNGSFMHVIRGDGTDVVGDFLDTALNDSITGQAVGTGADPNGINQITAAYRSVLDGTGYRCYAFWSSGEDDDLTDWRVDSNWVDTDGVLGTVATLARRLGVASRAFDHDGKVYVWTAFAGVSSFSGASPSKWSAQLQNTYFLYRDDAFLVAKAASGRAGGFSPSTGALPNVQDVGDGTYAWAGTERRIIELGEKQSGYGARAPREIRTTFDSDEARRTVRLGQTLYITGGEILQYDGVRLTEVGFHVYPWYFGAIEVPAGNLADGTYTYKVTWRWDNAQAELDRSTTATTGEVTIASGPNGVSIVSWGPLYVTHKTANALAVEVWRTPVNPTDDSPFYLVTSKNPAALSNPNRYIPNDTTLSLLATFNDELADADATARESNPENYGVLENLAPPAATIITANADRIFLAGVAGDPHRVWYSKTRNDGEVAAFHDALTVAIPPAGGAITGLAFLNETLIVLKETGIYALPGDGFDNTSTGANYGPARQLSGDIGAVSQESIALTDKGLIFKSRKGWYLLNRGWAVDYIGGPVCDYDAEEVLAVHVVEAQHQIRCLTSSRMLVLDTLVGQWAEWSIADGLDAVVWDGTYRYLTATGPKAEASDYTGVDYGLDIETAWIKLSDLQGFGRVYRAMVLGEYRSDHKLRVRIARNYEAAYVDDKIWTASPEVVGGPEQVQHGPSRPQCEAIKIRLTAVRVLTAIGEGGETVETITTPVGEALKLTGLALEVGIRRGLYKSLGSTQRQ